MALQSSGTIDLTDIQTEFGGTNPIGLSEYYRGGANTTSNNSNVPTSGAISLSDFYGGTSLYIYTISTNTQQANVRSLAVSDGWDGASPLKVLIDAGIYVWSDSTSTGGMVVAGSFPAGITIENSGYIIGKGGAGGVSGNVGQPGGPALVDSTGVLVLLNKSGAYIAGGGGGGFGNAYSSGGGGAGGGNGGGISGFYGDNHGPYYGGAGGAIGHSGANGSGSSNLIGYGGGAGGGGGSSPDYGNKSDDPSGAGGGGGRILNGSGGGGGGGAGGSLNSAGSPKGGNWYSAGGGGWGASGGGSGGSGGRGITWSSTAGTVTNNGTIYGAYT